MERPSKRRRLYGPLDAQVSQSFDSGHEFYDAPDEVHEEESESAYGPDQELEQKRARLDLKLKSTFESIFEKYGKDFEGVGDEIDLYTGEILVDNGHLLQMRNERDAGDPSRAQRFPRALVADSELVSGSMEDDYLDEEDDEDEDDDDDEEGDDEEDYDNDGALSDEEMIEDDLILRGFAQARQFMQRWPSEQQKTFNGVLAGHRKEQRQNTVLNSAMMRSMLPSRSDILSQFGPQLGPEIVKYVSQQAVLDDDNVEPMWRAPPILTTTVATYPKTKSAVLQPESQRPKSPDNSPSIWAPQRSRFRAEEDELLQDFVANARKVGLDLSNNISWKRLEDMHPRHDWKSWKTRYEKKFSYLCPGHVDDSEISTSEVSADTPWMANQRDRDRLANSRLDMASSTKRPPPPTTNSRPIRARKPARRDSTILSWTDAVATIESVDPDLHAGLLKDVKAIKSDASFGFQRFNPSSKIPEMHIIQDPTAFNKQTGSNQEPNGSAKHAIHSDNTIADSEDELSLQSPEFHVGSQKVPCPHADCRASQSTLYRLNCYDDEELSPLCLHLLHIHHNTPFPCVEFNCERKGERGYFMQEDLVRHVKEVHPYATALSRLRGRVDAELLDREPKSTHSQLSTTIRPRTPVSQPRESGFMSPRGCGSPAQPSIQMLSSSSANDLTFNTRPVHYDQAGSASALSLRVNPASSVAKAMQSTENSAEKLYDSDVQILESNPFLTECHSLSKLTQLPCSLRDSSGCDEMFASSKLAVSHSLVHNGNLKKASCTHLGCEKIISTNPSTMITHLKTHEKDHSNISASTRQAITSEQQPSQHTSTPVKSSSSLRTTNKPASTVTKKNTRGTTRKRVSDPLPQNKVDPSYQFSDEEVDLRLLQNEALQVTKAEPAQPRPARMSMPSAKAHTKSIFTSALKKPHVTPLFKPKPRKSAVKGTVAAEEFDELSLPCDGDLMFISSRSRSGDLPSMGSRMRVKQEDADIPSGSIASSQKRSMGMLDWSDEIDELGSDNIPTITSARGIQNLPAQCDVKMEEEAIPRSRLEVKGQAVTNRARKQKAPYQSDSQLTVTPTRSHKPSSGTNTPLMDLVGDDDQEVDLGVILPTSAMDSSPTARKTRNRIGREVAGSGSGARFGLRPVPRAMVKEEEGAVWTPGGTLRRCGQEGFACGRPFCFSCPQQA